MMLSRNHRRLYRPKKECRWRVTDTIKIGDRHLYYPPKPSRKHLIDSSGDDPYNLCGREDTDQ